MTLRSLFLNAALALAALLLLLGLIALVTPATQATPLSWTGTAGDNNWHTASNWSPAQVPGPADDVTIAFTTTDFVEIATANASCHSLVLASGLTPGSNYTVDLYVYAGTTLTVGTTTTITSGRRTTPTVRSTSVTLDLQGTLVAQGNIILNGTGNSKLDMNLAPTDLPVLVLDGTATLVKYPGGTLASAPGASTRLTGSSPRATPQVLNLASGLVYGNIEINKASNATDVVRLSTNVSDANVTGDLTVNTGILNNGGFGVVGASSTFRVKPLATFELAGTSGLPGGPGYTVVFEAGSVTAFAGSNQAISATVGGSYGDLVLADDASTPGAKKTLGGTIQIAGTLTIRQNTTLSTADASYLINDEGTAGGKTRRGSLVMEAGAELQILNTTTIPQPGLTGTYALAPSSTIRFMGGADQIVNTRLNVDLSIVDPSKDVDVVRPLPYANLVVQGSGTRAFTFPGDVFVQAGSTMSLTSGDASTVALLQGSLLTGGGNLAMTLGELRLLKADAAAQPGLAGTYALGGTSIQTFGGGGSQTISNLGGGANAYNILQTTGGGTKTLLAASTVAVSKEVRLATGSTLNGGTATLLDRGNWTNNGTFVPATGTVAFAGTTDQYLSGSALSASDFYNLTLANTGPAGASHLLLPAASGTALTVAHAYTQSSGFFDVRQNTLAGPATFAMSGGRLYLGRSGAGVTQPELTGTYALSAGTVSLTGSGAQALRGATYASLLLAGTGAKTLAADALVQDSLFLNDNQRTNLAGFLLTLGSGPARLGTLARGHALSTEYLYGGSFRRWLAAVAQPDASSNAALFPLGDATYTRPFYAAATTAPTAAGTLTLSHMATTGAVPPAPAYNDGATAIRAVTNMYWTLQPGAGLAGGQYTLRAGGEGIAGITSPADLHLVQMSEAVGALLPSQGTAAFPYAERSVAGASLGQRYRYGTGTSSSPLPVELIAFAATASGPAVALAWATAGERACAYFAVERSATGEGFAEIGRQAGHGTTAQAQRYAFADAQPLPGLGYYRLRQVDEDGRVHYSTVQAVRFAPAATTALAPRLLAYPNPATDALTLLLPVAELAPGPVQILDLAGRLLRTLPAAAAAGPRTLDVASLPAGTYLVRLAGYTTRFVRE